LADLCGLNTLDIQQTVEQKPPKPWKKGLKPIQTFNFTHPNEKQKGC